MSEEISLEANVEISKFSKNFFIVGLLSFLFMPVFRTKTGIQIFIRVLEKLHSKNSQSNFASAFMIFFLCLFIWAIISIILRADKLYKVSLWGILACLIVIILAHVFSLTPVQMGFWLTLIFMILALLFVHM